MTRPPHLKGPTYEGQMYAARLSMLEFAACYHILSIIELNVELGRIATVALVGSGK